MAGDSTSVGAQGLVFEPLYQYKYLSDIYELEPCLAEAMGEFSPDAMVHTVRIKKNVYFHDDPCFVETGGKGRELVAEDFIYGIKRLADIKVRSTGWWIFDGKIVGLDEFREKSQEATNEQPLDYATEIPGLKALDRYTLQITLKKPYPQLTFVLAMPYAVPVPREAVEYYGVELRNHPVGTGPYMLERWDRGLRLRYKKNPTYRTELFPAPEPGVQVSEETLKSVGEQLPLMPYIEFQVMLESQPMWLSFLRGLIDRSGIPKDNFDMAIEAGNVLSPELQEKGISLHIQPVMSVFFMIFNMEDEVLGQNKKLRQAISLAFDSQRRIEVFLNGRGLVATHLIPPGVPGHIENFQNPYQGPDMERAKTLLAEAGFPGGEGLPELTLDTTGGDPTSRQMAEMFVNEMAQLGIEINVETNTWPMYLEKLKGKKFQIGSSGWSADYPDAENFLQLLYGPNASPGPNSANYHNERYDQLYEKVSVMLDSTERRAMIREMIEISVEDCPQVYTFFPKSYTLSHQWYYNYRYRDVGQGYLKYHRIDSDQRIKQLDDL